MLEWTKPMTSKQAAKYWMTSGFVSIELYRDDTEATASFHRLWMACADKKDYDKQLWQQIEQQLYEAGVIEANKWIKTATLAWKEQKDECD